MKLKSVQGYDCRSICFGFVGATFQDGDVEDELCETEEEEPKPKEPKKDKCSKNSRGLLEI